MESKDFHETNVFAGELATAYGDGYAAIIREAGNLFKTLNTVNYDRMNVGHIEGRHRGLLQLDGMKAAAIAVMRTGSNQSHGEAEQEVNEHVTQLAKHLFNDVDTYHMEQARAARRARTGEPLANRGL